jgi:hypothetical protein
MSHTSLILSGLLLVAMAAFIAPSVLILNHGKILRNIAVWTAIFLGLILGYKSFGPGSPHPLFEDKGAKVDAMYSEQFNQSSTVKDKSDGSQGFTPPSE